MSTQDQFLKHIEEGYATKGDYINMGSSILDGETIANAFVKIPLKTLNCRGLIAGATGTGKTKTLQVIAENLSEKGIPMLKVLTSASFVGGILGVLKKVMS